MNRLLQRLPFMQPLKVSATTLESAPCSNDDFPPWPLREALCSLRYLSSLDCRTRFFSPNSLTEPGRSSHESKCHCSGPAPSKPPRNKRSRSRRARALFQAFLGRRTYSMSPSQQIGIGSRKAGHRCRPWPIGRSARWQEGCRSRLRPSGVW